MGMYKFTPDDAERFARTIGSKYKRRGSELVLQKCPYCHAGDRDTFSISLLTGQFECKRGSCRAKGNMITLSRDFNFSLNRDTDIYYQTTDYSRKQYRRFIDSHKETTDAAIEYLQKRGISRETAERFGITTHKDKKNVLVFPFRDETGELRFIKYRDMEYTKEKGTPKEWCESGCKPVLFGMDQCEGNDTLIITEGQIDSLSVAEAGINNAVSVPNGKNGFTWVPYCFDFVQSFNKIIVFGDCENGIISLAEEIRKRWDLKVRVVRAEDYQGCKDANEILQKHGADAIRTAIENAEGTTPDCIKPMAAVQYVDIMAMPMIRTGMREVDEVLDGGLRFGQLAVLTGKRGKGKSTLASQWVVEALAQNVNAFCYSGELPDYYFRNWMDRQITGKAKLNGSDIDQLNQYYGERAFIYNNTAVEEKDLLRAVEIAVVQKECRFVLLDNLMTAMDLDPKDDLYKAQSEFIGALAAMAKKYMAFVLVVAHPRKGNGQIGNDDISGSSNITDRADLVFIYGDDPERKDDNARLLEISKNRLTGRIAMERKGLQLIFEPGSKRVATDTAALMGHKYEWTKNDFYNFVGADGEEIPF